MTSRRRSRDVERRRDADARHPHELGLRARIDTSGCMNVYASTRSIAVVERMMRDAKITQIYEGPRKCSAS